MDAEKKIESPSPEEQKHLAAIDVPEIDHVAEAKLVRKLDLNIVWVVMALVNIGNARLFGLEEDLGLHGNQYQTAVSLLFVTYILCELPSNLVIKRLRPSRWIAFITTSWGIIATLTGVCQSYGGLIVCRLLLGAVEAGLFPGMTIYLTLFYTRRELALRIGYLFVSAALAGAFGGLLAYAIGNMDGVAGQRAWRWIMIIEGLPTFVLGIACWFILADDPENAYYLTPAEKELMVIRRMRQIGHTASGQEFHWYDAKKALFDWRVYLFCCGQFGADTVLYGYSTFLPTIIKNINPSYSAIHVQLLTIPCYALGAIAYLTTAYISDRQQRRGVYVVIFALLTVVGYAMLMSKTKAAVHYAGCFFVALGLYVVVGIPLAWLPANCPRYGKRAVASGMQLTIGNAAGIMAPFLYPTNEAPRFIRGHGVTLAMVAMAGVIYAFTTVYFRRRNKSRAAGDDDHTVVGMSEEEIAELGDENPRFVYTE